jgi:hypothetical protein
MSQFKLIVLSMFAVFAVGAIASASASADSCTGGTNSVFCFSSNNTPIHLEVVLGESLLSLLASKVGTAEVVLHCTHDLFYGLLHLLGLFLGEISFLGCTVEKPAGQGCTVGEGVNKLIRALLHIQLSSGIMPATGLATGSGPGEEFSKLTIAGAACTVKNTYTVSGLQTVEFPSGETSGVVHLVVAKKSGSKLKLGVEVASFSSIAHVHLASGLPWLIMLGV